MIIPFKDIDQSWTLFLDRDGVINKKIKYGYVRLPKEFEFEEGAIEAIEIMSHYFGRIIIVTNQRGIAKGQITDKGYIDICQFMCDIILTSGGILDAIYHCPHEIGECKCRKPDIGLFKMACEDFPEIDSKKSIMIGDSDCDRGFAQNAKMNYMDVYEYGSLLGIADLIKMEKDSKKNLLSRR